MSQSNSEGVRGRTQTLVMLDESSFPTRDHYDEYIETHQHDFGNTGECACGAHREPPMFG